MFFTLLWFAMYCEAKHSILGWMFLSFNFFLLWWLWHVICRVWTYYTAWFTCWLDYCCFFHFTKQENLTTLYPCSPKKWWLYVTVPGNMYFSWYKNSLFAVFGNCCSIFVRAVSHYYVSRIVTLLWFEKIVVWHTSMRVTEVKRETEDCHPLSLPQLISLVWIYSLQMYYCN